MKTRFWIVLGRRSPLQGGPCAPGWSREISPIVFDDPFSSKTVEKGSFWEPPKSPNGSKTALSSIDRRLDPPKIVSGRGSGKNMKNQWEIHRKIIHFEMLKTSKTMPCAMNSRLSVFRKILKKLCLKGAQKSWFWIQNRPLGVEGSIYRVFWLDLGRCRSGGQKINKNRPFGHQGPKRDQRSEPRWWIAATDETPGPQGTGRGREIPPPSRGRGIESRVLLNHLSPEGWWA